MICEDIVHFPNSTPTPFYRRSEIFDKIRRKGLMHPEVYIRVPFNYISAFRKGFNPTKIWSKTPTQYAGGNSRVLSEKESYMSLSYEGEKCKQVKTGMRKMMNSIYDLVVSHCTAIHTRTTGSSARVKRIRMSCLHLGWSAAQLFFRDIDRESLTQSQVIFAPRPPRAHPPYGGRVVAGPYGGRVVKNAQYNKNSGYPKGRETYGYGASVVVRYNDINIRIINYCTSEGGQNAFDIIKSNITSAKERVATKNIGFDQVPSGAKLGAKLIYAIADEHNLIQAYEAIKSKPGNITAAITKETLDGITLE